MQLSQIIAIMSASAVVTVHAMKAFEDYGVWTPQWDFEVTPGGDHIVLNGTVEQVLEQLGESNPKLMASFNLFGEDGQIIKTRDETDPLPLKDFRPDCSSGLEYGRISAWEDGIKYLKGVPGKPVNGPGPGQCGRVSCSWRTAIIWCNDDTKTKTLSTFRHIADGAKAAKEECAHYDAWHETFGYGRAYHKTDNWYVIVRGLNADEKRC